MNERTLQAYLFRSKKKIKKINETKSSQKFLMLDIKDVYPPLKGGLLIKA